MRSIKRRLGPVVDFLYMLHSLATTHNATTQQRNNRPTTVHIHTSDPLLGGHELQRYFVASCYDVVKIKKVITWAILASYRSVVGIPIIYYYFIWTIKKTSHCCSHYFRIHISHSSSIGLFLRWWNWSFGYFERQPHQISLMGIPGFQCSDRSSNFSKAHSSSIHH